MRLSNPLRFSFKVVRFTEILVRFDSDSRTERRFGSGVRTEKKTVLLESVKVSSSYGVHRHVTTDLLSRPIVMTIVRDQW